MSQAHGVRVVGFSLTWPPRLVGLLCLVGLLEVAEAPVVTAMPVPLGQVEFDNFEPDADVDSGTSSILDWESWPVKAAIVFIVFFASSIFCFMVIFPWMLRKRKAYWPKTAYGRCTSMVLSAVFWCIIIVFREEIFSADEERNNWVVFGVLIGIWLFFFIFILYVMRSPHARSSKQ